MIRLQHIIGLPVYAIDTGKYLGTVRDTWFNEHWHLEGLILDYSKWFTVKMKALEWEYVLSCGEDAIYVKNGQPVKTVKPKPLLRTFHIGKLHLKDLPVITVHGSQLGRVSDVYFYPLKDTKIIGYELTDGFISDIVDGRKWLNVKDSEYELLLGEHAIIVPTICESELEPVAASQFRG